MWKKIKTSLAVYFFLNAYLGMYFMYNATSVGARIAAVMITFLCFYLSYMFFKYKSR